MSGNRVHVKGYYRANGTYVKPHTRSSPGSKSGAGAASAGSNDARASVGGAVGQNEGRVYVDNAFNRQHGRVGKPLGTHVIPKSSTTTSSNHTSTAAGTTGYTSTGFPNCFAAGTTGYTSTGFPNCFAAGTTGYTSTGFPNCFAAGTTGYTSTGFPNCFAAGTTGYTSTGFPNYFAAGTTGYTSPYATTFRPVSASGEGVDNAYNRKHGHVGKPFGTQVTSSTSSTGFPNYFAAGTESSYTNVAPYTTAFRSVSATSGSDDAVGKNTSSEAHNAYNSKHGHVEKPLGTHVISSSTNDTSTGLPDYSVAETTSESGYTNAAVYETTFRSASATADSDAVGKSSSIEAKVYIDIAYNRKHGRVGKPLGTHVISEFSTSKKTLRYRPEQETVEESWKKKGISPSTGVSCLTSDVTSIPFNELKLERVIGRGGFGEVHACLWHGTPMAYKKLLLQRLSKKHLDSLVTEIKILAALNHPNTVRLFGIVVEEDKKGIVMEYMQRSLFRAIFIDEEEFIDEKKKRIVGQVASAVKYLHTREQKIAHCDIKSENVLLDSKDNAKLGDFGLSTLKNATESSQSSAAPPPPGQGTPRYSAPEVLRGELITSIDRLMQTDIYSLAIVVFEVVAEEEPFRDLSIKQLEANVGRGKLRPMSSTFALSHPMLELLAKCWDGSASKRPTATDFHAQWKKIPDLYAGSDIDLTDYVII